MSDHDILHEMYGLTPEQCVWWDKLSALVGAALDQFEKGYAVDVEAKYVALVKEICP